MTTATKPVMGRPRTEEYRKKSLRFSKIEDSFAKILDKLDAKSRKLVIETLDEIKK